MPLKRSRVNPLGIATSAKKRQKTSRAPHRGTASQPVLLDTQLSSPSSSPSPPPSPRQALVAASQAPNFEATLRDSRAESSIIRPTEGSEKATVTTSESGGESAYAGFVWREDNYDGFVWKRYPKYCVPPTTLSNRASWIYNHGYRIALRSNPSKVTWICHYCYKHKFDIAGRGVHDVSAGSPSAPARHLGESKKGHKLQLPSKRTMAPHKETLLERVLKTGCPQAVANALGGFNIQEFRLAAVTWLVENNLPLSQFESPSFRTMIQLASVEAERALWASHNSVSRYVVRLYNYLKPQVVAELSQSLSKIHISFDGWTTKGGKRGYLGIVAHYVDSKGNLKDLPIALPQLTGAHSGEAMAKVVLAIFKEFEITVGKLGYFVLDNAYNNNTTIDTLAAEMGLEALERRLACGPHTWNLVGQMIIFGKDKESYDNAPSEATNEALEMEKWRGAGPIGVLLNIINYIKTPQQYALFEQYQRLAHSELPAESRKVKEPVKPVVTRWNSYYECFKSAAELQLAVNGYANYHIQRIETADAYARSRNNKLPDAPDWMRTAGLTAHDWQVLNEYIDVLGPLKQATKRLEGRGNNSGFGAVADIIPVFEYLLTAYEDRLQQYESVIHDEHDESPEDHLAINLRAALLKLNKHYNKLDLSPAYYAATILHPRYKHYLDAAWAEKPDWLESSNRNFQSLWAKYKSLPKPRTKPIFKPSDIDDAIDSFIDPSGVTDNEEDEYESWKRSEPVAAKGSDSANNLIKYWVSLQDRYPNLSKLAIDMLSIPGSSCECERLFSELGDLLEPRRRNISPQLLAAIQCDRRWIRAGFGGGEVAMKDLIKSLTDDEMDAKFGVHTWESG